MDQIISSTRWPKRLWNQVSQSSTGCTAITWLCQQLFHFACRPLTRTVQATSRTAAVRHLFLSTVPGLALVQVLVYVGVCLEALAWENWQRNLKCYRNSTRWQTASAIIRGRSWLVDYWEINFGRCREKYGIPWHRADRMGLAGFRTGFGNWGFEGRDRGCKLFLVDCQEIHRCGAEFLGQELATTARNVSF